jgi:hypothetical protein
MLHNLIMSWLHHAKFGPYLLSHCLIIIICDHIQGGARVGDSREASPRGFGGPQVPNCIGANIVMSKASPGASHHYP